MLRSAGESFASIEELVCAKVASAAMGSSRRVVALFMVFLINKRVAADGCRGHRLEFLEWSLHRTNAVRLPITTWLPRVPYGGCRGRYSPAARTGRYLRSRRFSY